MYYNALIKTGETGEIYEFDFNLLNDLVSSIIEPYLKNENFQFDGYFIEPSKVKRIVISETNMSADDCVQLAYDELRNSGVFTVIKKEDCVFNNPKYAKDITREVLRSTKESRSIPEIKKGQVNDNVTSDKNKKIKTIFLGYSYRQVDDEFVAGFKELLSQNNFEVIDGKADGLGSISQAIIEKIELSDIVVIVMTKRDKKLNEKFTTSAWLLEEKGAALALKKEVGMFVEEEIDESDIGGMQGDSQRFHFTRNNFLNVAMNFLKIIKK